jgi:hypothetical protein
VVTGRVIDQRGAPLAGATIYRMEPDAPTVTAGVVSYEHLTEIAVSGSDGRFRAPGQPERALRLVGDYALRRFTSDGLSIGTPTDVRPLPAAVVDVELRLALDRSALATLEGTVVDDRRRPVRYVLVHADHKSAFSDAEGRFRLTDVGAGNVAVRVSGAGYHVIDRVETLAPGDVRRLDLELRGQDVGDLVVAGQVVDHRGLAAAGVNVWVKSADERLRHGTTSSDGAFRFEGLPARFGAAPVEVGVNGPGDRPAVALTLVPDVVVPNERLRIVAEATSWLHIVVVDATSGDTLNVFDVLLSREVVGDAGTVFEPMWSELIAAEDGTWRALVSRGRWHAQVRAPGHRPLHAVFDVLDDARVQEARLVAQPE